MVHRALLRRLCEQNEFATLADRRKFSSPCTVLSKCLWSCRGITKTITLVFNKKWSNLLFLWNPVLSHIGLDSEEKRKKKVCAKVENCFLKNHYLILKPQSKFKTCIIISDRATLLCPLSHGEPCIFELLAYLRIVSAETIFFKWKIENFLNSFLIMELNSYRGVYST